MTSPSSRNRTVVSRAGFIGLICFFVAIPALRTEAQDVFDVQSFQYTGTPVVGAQFAPGDFSWTIDLLSSIGTFQPWFDGVYLWELPIGTTPTTPLPSPGTVPGFFQVGVGFGVGPSSGTLTWPTSYESFSLGTFGLTWPSPQPGNVFWLVLEANSTQQVPETVLGNNLAVAGPFTPTGASPVDLEAQSLTLSPAPGGGPYPTGGSFDLSWTLAAFGGNAPIGIGYRDEIYLVETATGNRYDLYWGRPAVGSLAGGSTVTGPVGYTCSLFCGLGAQAGTFQWPGVPGTYDLYFEIDTLGTVAQTEATNDVAMITGLVVDGPALTPSLEPTNIDVFPPLAAGCESPGAPFDLDFEIANTGLGAYNGPITVFVAVIDAGGIPSSTDSQSFSVALPGGQTPPASTLPPALFLLDWPNTPGATSIEVTIVTANGSTTTTILTTCIQGTVDLGVDVLGVSAPTCGGCWCTGDSVTLDVAVINNGIASFAGPVQVQVFLNTTPDAPVGGGQIGQSAVIDCLTLNGPFAVGSTPVPPITVTLADAYDRDDLVTPGGGATSYEIGVKVDSDCFNQGPGGTPGTGVIVEFDETNNEDSLAINLCMGEQPDLVAIDGSVQATAIQGGTFTLQYTVLNQGLASTDLYFSNAVCPPSCQPVTANFWADRFYLLTPGGVEVPLMASLFAPLEVQHQLQVVSPSGTLGPFPLTAEVPSVPAGVTYEIHVRLDDLFGAGGSVSEGDTNTGDGYDPEDNDFLLGSIQILPAGPPDFDVTSLALANPGQTLFPGASFDVSYEVLNIGGTNVGGAIGWFDRFSLVEVANPASVVFLDDLQQSALSGVPNSYGDTVTLTVPNVPCLDAGAYRIRLDVVASFDPDPSNDVEDTANVVNLESGADLAILPGGVPNEPPIPSQVLPGTSTRIAYRVRNVGSAPVVVPTLGWTEAISFVPASGPSTYDSVLVPSPGLLAPGDEVVIAYDLDIDQAAVGPATITITTNAGMQVCEGPGGGSNELSFTVEVLEIAPEFEIAAMALSSSTAQTGDAVTVSWTVTNVGPVDGPDLVHRDFVLLSDDLVPDADDEIIATRLVFGPLAMGASYSREVEFEIDPELDGPYFVLVVADGPGAGAIVEIDDSNVTDATLSVTQVLSDIALSNLTFSPAAPLPESQRVTVTYDRQNLGPGTPTVGTVTEAIFLSTDPVLDDGDIALESFPLATPGVTPTTETRIVRLPRALTGPNFHLLVATDRLGDVAQPATSSAMDNDIAASAAFAIDPLPPTNLQVECSNPQTNDVLIGAPFDLDTETFIAGPGLVGSFRVAAQLVPVAGAWDPTAPSAGFADSDDLVAAMNDVVLIDFTQGQYFCPLLDPGAYDVVILTDSADWIPETVEDDNDGFLDCNTTTVATVMVEAIDIPSLGGSSGLQAIDPTRRPEGAFRVFAIDTSTASEQTIRVTIEVADRTALIQPLIRYGSVPRPDAFDVAPVAGIDPPGPEAYEFLYTSGNLGTDFLLVSVQGDASTTLEVTTEILATTIAQVTPDRIGDAGEVTVTILGTGFEAGWTAPNVELFPTGDPSSVVSPVRIVRVSSTELRATFDLTGSAVLGAGDVADLRLLPFAAPAETALAAITVEPRIAPTLELFPAEVSNIRAGSVSILATRVVNVGNVDAPYVVVSHRTTATPGRIPLAADSSPQGFPFSATLGGVHLDAVVRRSLAPGEDITFECTYDLEPPLLTGIPLPSTFDLQRGASVFSAEEIESLVATIAEEVRVELDAAGTVPPTWPGTNPSAWLALWRSELESAGFVETVAPTPVTPIDTTPPVENCLGTSLEGVFFADLLDELHLAGVGILDDPLAETLLGIEARCQGLADLWEVGLCSEIPILAALDPNEKDGDPGFGGGGFFGNQKRVRFTIYFENIASGAAGTAASRVEIRDPLGPGYRPESVRFEEAVLGDEVFGPSEPLAFHFADEVAAIANPLEVRTTMYVDLATNEVVWVLEAIDPLTGLPPVDASQGWLPPGGTGSVRFTVLTQAATGGGIVDGGNRALITFDGNEPLATEYTENLIDPDPPENVVIDATVQAGGTIALDWSGEDAPDGAGLMGYRVEALPLGLPPLVLAESTLATSLDFSCAPCAPEYAFRVVATDHVGNAEAFETPSIVLESPFRRGDCNQSGSLNIADAINGLEYLFVATSAFVPDCFRACDANGDGGFDITDPIYLLDYLFAVGTEPPAPFPDCGISPSPSTLDCVSANCP